MIKALHLTLWSRERSGQIKQSILSYKILWSPRTKSYLLIQEKPIFFVSTSIIQMARNRNRMPCHHDEMFCLDSYTVLILVLIICGRCLKYCGARQQKMSREWLASKCSKGQEKRGGFFTNEGYRNPHGLTNGWEF